MPTGNFIVSDLAAYVQQNRDLILKNLGLIGEGTRRRMGIQTGIKSKAALNYFEIDPVLQSGAECGFDAAGTATLTQRDIEVAAMKVNMEICPKNLLGTYAEYLVRLNAFAEELPFEQYVVDGIIRSINEKIEKAIWQGDTASLDTDLNHFDGILKLADAEADVIDVAIASGTTAYEGIKQVYMALPAEALKRGASISVAPEIFRLFMMEMVEKNFYHYSGPQDENRNDFVFPGTNVKVVSTEGLAGSLKIVGTFDRNLVYGTDMEGDMEDVKIWFSDDDDVVKIKVLWTSGVQFAFPNLLVLGTFAARPTA